MIGESVGLRRVAMSDEITSHNQKGGITAKNVTVTSGASVNTAEQSTSAESSRKGQWRIWAYISGAVVFVAAVVGILEYFGIEPW